jgi:hypothetical protein
MGYFLLSNSDLFGLVGLCAKLQKIRGIQSIEVVKLGSVFHRDGHGSAR